MSSAPDAQPAQPAQASRSRPLRLAVELVVTLAAALALALAIQAFVVKPYKIPTGSMEPTLVEGQRVLVNRLGNDFWNPHVGEIVVFHPPMGAEEDRSSCAVAVQPYGLCARSIKHEDTSNNFIKRVVGIPGDRISIVDGHVIRNGVREADSYTYPCGSGSACNFPNAITVPRGYYYMMGDNRGDSFDSRYWGPIPRSWIIGVAFATYWPPDRIGLL